MLKGQLVSCHSWLLGAKREIYTYMFWLPQERAVVAGAPVRAVRVPQHLRLLGQMPVSGDSLSPCSTSSLFRLFLTGAGNPEAESFSSWDRFREELLRQG